MRLSRCPSSLKPCQGPKRTGSTGVPHVRLHVAHGFISERQLPRGALVDLVFLGHYSYTYALRSPATTRGIRGRHQAYALSLSLCLSLSLSVPSLSLSLSLSLSPMYLYFTMRPKGPDCSSLRQQLASKPRGHVDSAICHPKACCNFESKTKQTLLRIGQYASANMRV